MKVGSVTLPTGYTPLKCTKPRPELSTAVVSTYGGVAVFDWGSLLPGKKITMEWKSMTVALFESLDTVFQAGEVIVWDSGINSKSYNVKLTAFDGSLLWGTGADYMMDVTLTMFILSEVTA